MTLDSESPRFVRNKVVLIISPQPWGTLWISKHHYALECSRHARMVYFLNPPDYSLDVSVRIDPVPEAANIKVISYRPFFPFVIRFHLRWLFNYLMIVQINRIRREIVTPINVVWCFDFNLFSDLRRWKAETRIFHPVDPLNHAYQAFPGETSDLVLSVSDSILKHFGGQPTRSARLDHGVARCFLDQPQKQTVSKDHQQLSFGYIGNLIRGPVDRNVWRQIISTYPEIRFVFWGPYSASAGVAADLDSENFVNELKAAKNVELRGLKCPETLAEEMQDMDGFLLIYLSNREYDCSNSHKILEYMSTGKVLISSPIAAYVNRGDLVRMPASHEGFAETFSETIANISIHNTPELLKRRREFAAANSYSQNLVRIDNLLNGMSN